MKLMMKLYPGMFAQLLWTLKFVFSHFHGKLFSVLLQATIYIFNFKEMQKGRHFKILKIIMVQDICLL